MNARLAPSPWALSLCCLVLAARSCLAGDAPSIESRKLYQQGQILFAAGQLEQALALYARAKKQSPAYVEAHQRYQDTMIRLDRRDDLAKEYRAFAASGAFKGTPLALYLRARIEDDLKAREELLKTAAAGDPDFAWAWHGLGYLYERLDRWVESDKAFAELLRLQPDAPGTHNAVGFLRMQQGKNAEAEAQFEKALKLDPRDLEARLNLTYLALRQHDYNRAIKRAKEVLALDKDNPWAHNNLGKAYYGLHFYTSAEKAFKKALSQPRYDSPELAYLNLGFVYRRRRKHDLAAAAYRQAVEIRPDFAYAHNSLAQVLYHQEKFKESWKHVHRAQQLGYEVREEFLKALREKLPEPK